MQQNHIKVLILDAATLHYCRGTGQVLDTIARYG